MCIHSIHSTLLFSCTNLFAGEQETIDLGMLDGPIKDLAGAICVMEVPSKRTNTPRKRNKWVCVKAGYTMVHPKFEGNTYFFYPEMTIFRGRPHSKTRSNREKLHVWSRGED